MQIKDKILTIRNKKVILDRDLAKLYEVETKYLNRVIKRNKERFPDDFAFRLTEKEISNLRCHFVTSKHGGNRYLPHAFTEHGVSMLAGLLKSEIAIKISIRIIEEFIALRKFVAKSGNILTRITNLEQNQIQNNAEHIYFQNNFKKLFSELSTKQQNLFEGIFYNGQIFDAYEFISKLIKQANKEIILIDNYIDESILTLFKKTTTKVTIYTKITDTLKLDLKKYNKQYDNIKIIHYTKSHDRFLIIDNDLYHIGASLKDLGKKMFAFSKMEDINIQKNLLNQLN